MHLPLTTLHAVYRVTRPFRTPYHEGGLIHGILGRALLSLSCRSSPHCPDTCTSPTTCALPRLFKPAPRPDVATAVRFGTAQSPPPPIIPLIAPEGGQQLTEGAEFSFGLRCIGALSPADLDLLLSALERFADFPLADEGGRVSVASIGFAGPRTRTLEVIASPDDDARRLSVRFETPTWLSHDGRLATDLDFPTLLRACWRRLAVLAALYGEESPLDDATFAELDALAHEVTVTSRHLRALRWERRSDLKSQRHPMEGLVGTVEFSGPVGPFRSVLDAAQLVHLGKQTAFGLGRIRAQLST